MIDLKITIISRQFVFQTSHFVASIALISYHLLIHNSLIKCKFQTYEDWISCLWNCISLMLPFIIHRCPKKLKSNDVIVCEVGKDASMHKSEYRWYITCSASFCKGKLHAHLCLIFLRDYTAHSRTIERRLW